MWVIRGGDRKEKDGSTYSKWSARQNACGAEACTHQSHTTSVSMAFLTPFNKTWEWHYVTNRNACPAGVAHLLHSSAARKTKTKNVLPCLLLISANDSSPLSLLCNHFSAPCSHYSDSVSCRQVEEAHKWKWWKLASGLCQTASGWSGTKTQYFNAP